MVEDVIVVCVIILAFTIAENGAVRILGERLRLRRSWATIRHTIPAVSTTQKKTEWRSCLAHQKHMAHKRLINRQLHHIDPELCMRLGVWVCIFGNNCCEHMHSKKALHVCEIQDKFAPIRSSNSLIILAIRKTSLLSVFRLNDAPIWWAENQLSEREWAEYTAVCSIQYTVWCTCDYS